MVLTRRTRCLIGSPGVRAKDMTIRCNDAEECKQGERNGPDCGGGRAKAVVAMRQAFSRVQELKLEPDARAKVDSFFRRAAAGELPVNQSWSQTQTNRALQLPIRVLTRVSQ